MSLREVALAHKLEIIESAEFDQNALAEYVRRNRIDAVLVCMFSKILKCPLLDAPRLGCLNVHPSLLPTYRGPHPFYWVLANGETRTGVTLHFMDEGIDTGSILLQREVEIRPGDDEKALLKRTIRILADVVPDAFALLANGKVSGTPQDESRATYYSLPPKGASRL
jgi:methionyl-tRNA formyltransferase